VFEPKSGAHSIVEAVVGFAVQRPFSHAEIESVVASHPKWREQLPRLGRMSVVEFTVGPSPQSAHPPAGGVIFDRIKPDGNIAWRLNVNERNILVNCLEYSRWHEIWPRMHSLLNASAEVAIKPSNRIVNLTLQFIDIFEWNGVQPYDIRQLLNLDGRILPADLAGRGSLWHVHQGWFERLTSLSLQGRALKRIHIDAVTMGKTPAVKFDTTIRFDLAEPIVHSDILGTDMGANLYETLHQESKRLFRSLLSSEAAKRIGL